MRQERSIRKRLDAIDRLADHLLEHHRERLSALLLAEGAVQGTVEGVRERARSHGLEYDQDRGVGERAHGAVIHARNLDETITKD